MLTDGTGGRWGEKEHPSHPTAQRIPPPRGMDREMDDVPPPLTFADPNFVLRDGVPVERRPDDTAQPPVASSVKPVDSTAALVPLPSAHETATADPQHDTTGAALRFFAFRLVAGQADQSPRPRLAQ